MPFSLTNKQKLALGLLALCLVGLAVFTYAPRTEQKIGEDFSQKVQLNEGAELPLTFAITPVGGSSAVTLADYKDKVLVINFWAGWCGPCVHEMPGLYALQKKYQERGFSVLGLVMDDDPQDGLALIEKKFGKSPFPQFRGVDSGLADTFNVDSLPFTVIVDKNRKIQYARPGEVNWGASEVHSMIDKML